jgi:signal transduction histidine kinase
MPHLDRIIALSEQANDNRLAMEIRQRIEVIATGVAGIMSELHRRLLAEAGLVCSIKSLVERFRQATGIETALFTNISPAEINLTADCNLALYRVTQEALNNVEKHAHASRVLVSLHRTAGELMVSIEDNGRGITEKQVTQSRGLRNMSERADGIGAQVTFSKSISFDSGTLVSISIALD